MEPHMSVAHKRIENSIHGSPTSSSPLRRSLVLQKMPSSVFSENDDEAERIARRREISFATPLSTNTNIKRHSLGLGFLANIPAPQMAESINQCIKLSAENKINIKNAFSLEMIDFMIYMIKKQDDNMSNLQVASTSLDVSTKIYGFRVDSVHTEILKIVGGLDKQTADDVNDSKEHGEIAQEGSETNTEIQKKKKRKKLRQKIFAIIETLKGNVEIVKPTSMMIGEGDLQTSDMLYQAILPNHANSGFYQHLYNDVLVDIVENKCNSQNNVTKYTIPNVENFVDLEISTTYSNFEFLGWSVDDEPEEASSQDVEHDETNKFQFDLNASIEQDNDPLPEPVNYFDIEHDDEENVYGCYKEVNRAENIVNVDGILDSSVTLKTVVPEYSFMQSNLNLHWAGPSHWKFRNVTRSFGSAKVVGACMQAPLRKRKEIELSYDENKDVVNAKFALSQSNKLHAKTAKAEWCAENLTLPEDVHYNIAQATKLYLHQNLGVKPSGKDNVATADVSDTTERYDYNNPNDTSDYCPDVNNKDYDECRDDNEDCNFRLEDDGVFTNQGLIGENLVTAPKLANKMSIAYCLKAKKIDMRQLKRALWNCLMSNSNTDCINIKEAVEQMEEPTMKESKQFSNVYKILPKLLTKTNAEALSVPISFISLLHLANEKILKVHSLPDLSDIIVERN